MVSPPSIPRFVDDVSLRADPLWFLRTAQRSAGQIVVIKEDGPLFSRSLQCAGVVAVFGSDAIQQVLTDTDTFGMPVSVGERFSLPPRMVRLNSGLFSMHGEQHRAHQQLLARLLGRDSLAIYGGAIVEGWKSFREDLAPEADAPLLTEMRRLVLNVSGRIMFGSSGLRLGKLIQTYFDERREFSRIQSDSDPNDLSGREFKRSLVRNGLQVDTLLRARLKETLEEEPRCMFARLTKLELTEDQQIAHANVLFMSSSEPLAVALTWALLLLSQHPDVLAAVQRELAAVFSNSPPPDCFKETDLPVLLGVVLETLRLLPPNAIMARLTSKTSN